MTVPALTMRPARVDELPALVALLFDDMLGSGREDADDFASPVYRDAFAAIDRDPNQMLVVAELDGAIAGMMQLTFIPGLSHRGAWRGQIEAVRIAAPLRGRGYGRQMIAWGIDTCRERGCRMVQLTSNKSRSEAHRFYGGLGFEATHTGFKLVL